MVETFSNILHFKRTFLICRTQRVVLAPILTTTAVYQQCRWGMPLFFEKASSRQAGWEAILVRWQLWGQMPPPVWGPHRSPWPLASWGTQGGAGLHRHSCLPAGPLGKMNDFWANLNLLLWDLLLFHLLFLKKACIFKICISSPKCVCVFIVFVP